MFAVYLIRFNRQKVMSFFWFSILIISHLQMQKNFWKPDTYFDNVKAAEIHTVTLPNIMLRINKSGEVLYSVRWENFVLFKPVVLINFLDNFHYFHFYILNYPQINR